MDPAAVSLKYQPLNIEANEIRLLVIQNTDDSEEISCQLQHVPLTDNLSYKALSYCWGDSKLTRQIKINGVDTQVTENLEAALRELRRQACTCLWVDAICINQGDLAERGRQVQRMGSIYAKAEESIAWLGVEADNSNLALSLIQVLSTAESNDHSKENLHKATEALAWFNDDSSNHRYSEHWIALELLYQRPYWRRIWIIQEIVFAKSISLLCGSRSVTWDCVTKATNQILPGNQSLRASSTVLKFRHASGMGAILTIDVLRDLTQEARGNTSEYRSLLNAITRSTESLASDRRDKIYAILSLTKDGSALVPSPDYKRSAEDLFIAVTTAIILATRDLDVICYATCDPSPQLPTWAPNWGNKLVESLVWQNVGDDLYDATGILKAEGYTRIGAEVEFIHRGLVLKALGFMFDLVDGLSEVVPYFQKLNSRDNETDYGNVHPETMTSPYASEGKIFEAIWRSLLLNRRPFQASTPEFLSFMHIAFRAADLGNLAREFRIAFEPWYQCNKSFRIHSRELKDWWSVWCPAAKNAEEDRNIEALTFDEINFLDELQNIVIEKRLLVTKTGYIGMAPFETRKGDIVCLLLGCRVPVVLRKSGEGYHLIGDVYIHGIMNGEALTQDNYDKLEYFHIH